MLEFLFPFRGRVEGSYYPLLVFMMTLTVVLLVGSMVLVGAGVDYNANGKEDGVEAVYGTASGEDVMRIM